MIVQLLVLLPYIVSRFLGPLYEEVPGFIYTPAMLAATGGGYSDAVCEHDSARKRGGNEETNDAVEYALASSVLG